MNIKEHLVSLSILNLNKSSTPEEPFEYRNFGYDNKNHSGEGIDDLVGDVETLTTKLKLERKLVNKRDKLAYAQKFRLTTKRIFSMILQNMEPSKSTSPPTN